MLDSIGKLLIYVGGGILVLGLLLVLLGRVPGLGRLPGDVLIRRDNATFYFPLGTMLLLSVVLTLLLHVISRLRR